MKTLKTTGLTLIVLALFAFATASQTPLPKLDGGTADVQAQKGKIVVLAIGASWLPLSNKQAEYTNMLAKKYAGRDVVFYFVMTDSTNVKSRNYADDASVRKFGTENKLTISILRDSDGSVVLKKFKFDQVPSFVILDKNGNQAGDAFEGIDPKFDITVPISKKVDSLL